MVIDFIDSKEVSAILGISEATIKNWIRHRYLKPISEDGKTLFNKSEVYDLKKKIQEGEIDRLNNRANKGKSNKTFIPSEYHNLQEEKKIKDLIDFIKDNNIDKEESIFLLSIKQLSSCGLIAITDFNQIKIRDLSYKNEDIRNIILEWYSDLNSFKINDIDTKLFYFDMPKLNDFLGLIYQSLLLEGEKADLGSYYTPKNIIENISRDYTKDGFDVLDPCCGTGQFLLTLAESIKNPLKITGWDIDPIAVKICKINLLIKFKDFNFSPKIYCINTLLDSKNKEHFDLIATNPPWGYHFKQEEIERINKLYPQIKSEESFSFFLKKAIELLKPEGIVSFILPEAILNVSIHRDIREYIIKNTEIEKIIFLNRVFKNVFTNVIRLDLSKNNSNNKKIKIILKDNNYKIEQDRFKENKDFVFNIFSSEIDESIISKVYSYPHLTLKNNAEWALGIVTGNNKKYISPTLIEGYEPIITGKEVSRFLLLTPNFFTKFEPKNFQQVAPTERYRADEKLIYKFISNKLIFAYDSNKLLTLNSANILIPKIDNYPIKIILALLNSKIYQFIYKKKFNSIKVLRSHIEELPLPLLETNIQNRIISLVNKILNKEDVEKELDEELLNLFKLNKEEREYLLKQN